MDLFNNFDTAVLVNVAYIAASILFIVGLKMLGSPDTARRGNLLSSTGMLLAILVTLADQSIIDFTWILVGLISGGIIGYLAATRVQMTSMPEMVAIFNGFGGIASLLVGSAEFVRGSDYLFPIFLTVLIGGLTFTGSLVAYGKLSEILGGRPTLYKGQQIVNSILLLLIAATGIEMIFLQQIFTASETLLILCGLAMVLGILFVIPIGGADMPVVVSMLNSYSGWAAAGIGFSLNNSMLIIAGSLVGSSGAILSYIMCKAMNRSFFSVILGGFGAEEGAQTETSEARPVKSGSADDVAFLLGNSDSVVIVPGYGLAVARAQHAVKEMTEKLISKGVDVRYAIHPVAGRMPGHMNVLLAEAEVAYDQVFEMEDINSDFGQTDVVFVLGANDVVNPAARTPGSAIYGMPILEAHKANNVIVNKRSMASGYAGLDNELFYMDKTMMVFGDAKKVVEDILKALD